VKWRKQLAFQLALRYALLIIVSFALVFASFYTIMTRAMIRERSNVLRQRLAIIVEGLDNRLNSVMALQTDMLRDETLQSSLKSPGVSYSLSAQLNRYRAGSYLFNALYLFDAQYNTLAISRPTTETGGIDPALRSAVEAFAHTLAFREFATAPDGAIYFLFALYPPHSYDYSYYGAAQVNRDRLFFDFSKDALDAFSAVNISDGVNPVFQIGPDALSKPGAADGSAAPFSDSHIAFERVSAAYSPWKVTALYDQSAFRADSFTQLGILLMIFLLTVILALIVSMLMARGIVHPVRLVLESMKRLEQGDYPPPLPVRRDDEIGQLVQGYNHAVQRLSDLNRDILAEQQEKRHYEVLSIQTQLDLLQSQINPHFIHNTLNTLNFMALRDGNRELSEVIVSFNALLRASINVTREYTTVSEEFEYVRQYMRIQQHRYADRVIECQFTADEASRDALLPRMILQPLVENSLFHGILPNQGHSGRIHLVSLMQNDVVSLFIIDNGVGISEEKLEKLNRGEIRMTNGYSHIGLNNVKERLALMYPSQSTFAIISQEGEGTTIFFSVPYRR